MSFKKCHVIPLEPRKLAKLKKTQSDQQVMEQLDREIFIGVNCTTKKKKTLFSMSKTNFERKQNT